MTREERTAYMRLYRLTAHAQAYREANREKAASQQKAWRETHPAQTKAWRDANREKRAARSKAFDHAHPVWRKWIETNSKAKARGAMGRVAFEPFRNFWESRGDTCPTCHKVYGDGKSTPSVDHVQSLNCGGLHEISNLQVICWGCNAAKQDKTIRY